MKMVVLGLTAALMFQTASADQTLHSWVRNGHPSVDKVDAIKIVRLVKKYANINDLDPKLVLAIISLESGFNSKASNLGAKGLMQVQQAVHRKLIAGRDITDVETNIDVGTKILKDCEDTGGSNLSKTLGCYSGRKGKAAKRYTSIIMKKIDKFNT
jgi:soluble lytic murein transglycosylase-like protein